MSSQPPPRKPTNADIPAIILAAATQDEQLQAATRSWLDLPKLTQDRMLARAQKLMGTVTPESKRDTKTTNVERTSSRLRRPPQLPAGVADDPPSRASATMKLPAMEGSGRSRQSAVQRLPPGPERQQATRRLWSALGIILVVIVSGLLVLWWAATPQ